MDWFWVLRLETVTYVLISCAMSLSSWDLLESLGSLSSWTFLFSRVDSYKQFSWHRFLIVSCPRCGPGLFRSDGVHGDGACHRDFHEFSQTLSRYVSTRRCQSRRSCISSSGTSLGQSHGAQLPCLEIPNKCHTQCFLERMTTPFCQGAWHLPMSGAGHTCRCEILLSFQITGFHMPSSCFRSKCEGKLLHFWSQMVLGHGVLRGGLPVVKCWNSPLWPSDPSWPPQHSARPELSWPSLSVSRPTCIHWRQTMKMATGTPKPRFVTISHHHPMRLLVGFKVLWPPSRCFLGKFTGVIVNVAHGLSPRCLLPDASFEGIWEV